MSVWRDVEEAIDQRFVALWGARTAVQLGNEVGFEYPDGQWVQLLVQPRAGGVGTIGRPGNRKMDRHGVVFVLVRGRIDEGSGPVADMAEEARKIYEGCRFGPHKLRFNNADIGDPGFVDKDRWWGMTVEAPFDYEETK